MRAMLPDTEGKVDSEGVKLHYEIYGSGDHTIVFVPTWAITHSRVWKAQVPYFAEHFRVITYDPRGNGLSDRPSEPAQYSTAKIVRDVIAVMDQTNTDKAILVGLSLSCQISFAVAAHYPNRVTAVVSTGGSSGLVPSSQERTDAYQKEPVPKPTGWEKFNASYWQSDYPDFIDFFMGKIHNEPHSTKLHEDTVAWGLQGDGDMLRMTLEAPDEITIDEEMYRQVACPSLIFVGDKDEITSPENSYKIVDLTGGELQVFPGAGHGLHARFPAKFNTIMRDFLARHLGSWQPGQQTVHSTRSHQKRALYLSSPIGLGHARRDLAITRELRKLHPDLQVDWLAQDPVTRFLEANKESVHRNSKLLANESAHIEDEAGEHDLNAFQAIRSMDEILIKNFMVFQEVLEAENYDLVIADEAWDVDHYWHEHPNLKMAPIAWMTDFVGWLPMKNNGPHEAFLTTDYNAEMIGHVERNPNIRDRAIFVGNQDDIVPMDFGENLPQMRDWVPKHFEFSGYILGQHPAEFGEKPALRHEFKYRDGEKICIVSVGGSGVGASLIRLILEAYPTASSKIPELRMIIVTGPRLDPAMFQIPHGVEVRSFVPNLDQHLAACDLAIVQGGLTTCMELTAAATPFLYFPLRNHFEQNFHVAHRLDRYQAGRKMIFEQSTPEVIASAMVEELSRKSLSKAVEGNGALRAASMIAEML